MKVIKETMDAVRVAEMEAEKQISTAKENAADNRVFPCLRHFYIYGYL